MLFKTVALGSLLTMVARGAVNMKSVNNSANKRIARLLSALILVGGMLGNANASAFADGQIAVTVKSVGDGQTVRTNPFIEVVDVEGAGAQAFSNCSDLQNTLGNQLELHYRIAGLEGSQTLANMTVTTAAVLPKGLECGVKTYSLFKGTDFIANSNIFDSNGNAAVNLWWTYNDAQAQLNASNGLLANPLITPTLTWISPSRADNVSAAYVIKLANKPVAPYKFDSFNVQECLTNGSCKSSTIQVGKGAYSDWTHFFVLSDSQILVETFSIPSGTPVTVNVTANYVSTVDGQRTTKQASQSLNYSRDSIQQPLALADLGSSATDLIETSTFKSNFTCGNLKAGASKVSCSVSPILSYSFKGFYPTGKVRLNLCEWRNLLGFERLQCGFTDNPHAPFWERYIDVELGQITKFTLPLKKVKGTSVYFQAAYAQAWTGGDSPDFWYTFK